MNFIGKLLIALGFASLLAFLSIFPNVGYFGSAHVSRKDVKTVPVGLSILQIVKYTYNITHNPIIYPLTWLSGGGHTSDNSSMIALPKSHSIFAQTKLSSTKELEEDALGYTAYLEMRRNFPLLFAIALAIEILEVRQLLACLLVGVFGFVPLGPVGTILGLLIGIFAVVLVAARSSKESRFRHILGIFRKD